jgi:urate oxidase
VLKSAGSEFRGFARDRYTTLQETSDRILATAVTARWRFATLDVDWAASFATVRAALLQAFAGHHSLSLQQTLYEMGRAALEAGPHLDEIRLSMPNRHHFDVDVARFGLVNRHEVFQIADRPYGLIEGTVRREGAPAGPPLDW